MRRRANARELLVGTSGWDYPTWSPAFYPPGTGARRRLDFYATQLNAVEVNYTFRKLPTPATVADWLARTSAGFRFAFKAPQRITHFKRLIDCEELVGELRDCLKPVAKANRLGPILFQLPPNFKANHARLESFLSLPPLRGRSAPTVAFEFRHDSWFTEETYATLRRHQAALCVAITGAFDTPEIHTAEDFTYFRLRQPRGYTPSQLDQLATRLQRLSTTRSVYAFLRHEDEPTGALNACDLRQMAARFAQAGDGVTGS